MSNLPAKVQKARALQQQGEFAQARAICEKILRVHPNNVDALNLLGQIAGQAQDLERAVRLFDKAIAIDPKYPAAHCNRGLALQGLRRPEAALASYNQALALKPDYAVAHYNRGNVLKELGQTQAALAGYDSAIAIHGGFAHAHYNRGVLLQEIGSWDEALASYDKALAARADYAEAYYNRGVVLQTLERLDAALLSYNAAIAIKADYAEACSNRAIVLQRLGQLDAALLSCNQAIAIRADYAEAYCNRGVVLHRRKELHAALSSYDQAIAIRADFSSAHYDRGNVLRDLKRFDAAIESYDRAIALNCKDTGLYGLRRHARMQICDWRDFDAERDQLIARIDRNEAATPPFHALVLSDCARLQRKAAESWGRAENPSNPRLPAIQKHAGGKIKVGYFSADYRNHATSHLIAELFELHDRTRFELTAVSFGPDARDAMRQRLEAACDRFIDVRQRNDEDVARLTRNLQIDIAVDLMGFTQGSRPGIFALRAAPLQVGYLGYPGTMGVEYMDYLIADRTVVPDGHELHFSEKIIYLPDSYQVNDRRREIAGRVFSREELGLPRAGLVFCCFNNTPKITPEIFEVWMRILRRTEDSVLWLLEDNALAAENLRREAGQRQVDSRRLIFAPRMPLPEHLARHRAADLFLDTLPYNAHTTASDALWSGLPVLTCAGEAFASRVAASLLTALRMPELVVSTLPEYEELAVRLATHPEELGRLREKLDSHRLTAPLFDTPLFTRHIEAAYSKIYAQSQADRPPEPVWV